MIKKRWTDLAHLILKSDSVGGGEGRHSFDSEGRFFGRAHSVLLRHTHQLGHEESGVTRFKTAREKAEIHHSKPTATCTSSATHAYFRGARTPLVIMVEELGVTVAGVINRSCDEVDGVSFWESSFCCCREDCYKWSQKYVSWTINLIQWDEGND